MVAAECGEVVAEGQASLAAAQDESVGGVHFACPIWSGTV
jgi:hypothetical protein